MSEIPEPPLKFLLRTRMGGRFEGLPSRWRNLIIDLAARGKVTGRFRCNDLRPTSAIRALKAGGKAWSI